MKWIKIENKLPDFGKTVLMYSEDYLNGEVFRGYVHPRGGRIFSTNGVQVFGVTHFMPLPESPNEYNTEQ